MWRTFYHTDLVTCQRVFTRVWVTTWKFIAPAAIAVACGKDAATLPAAPFPPPAVVAAAPPVAPDYLSPYDGLYPPSYGSGVPYASGGTGSIGGTGGGFIPGYVPANGIAGYVVGGNIQPLLPSPSDIVPGDIFGIQGPPGDVVATPEPDTLALIALPFAVAAWIGLHRKGR